LPGVQPTRAFRVVSCHTAVKFYCIRDKYKDLIEDIKTKEETDDIAGADNKRVKLAKKQYAFLTYHSGDQVQFSVV